MVIEQLVLSGIIPDSDIIVSVFYLKCAICQDHQELEELYPENLDLHKIDGETFSARRTPDRMHYRFVKCSSCGLIFSSPILEPEKIARLYSKSDFRYGIESKYLQKTYGGYLKLILNSLNPSKLKLLDIGCGNGFFLVEAKKLGVKNVYGVEPGKKSVAKAAKWLKDKIKRDIFKREHYSSPFDIITCFHTLDHIVDPNKFVSDVYKSLKKGGVALFIVHDTGGLSVKLLGEKSPIFDIEHIYLFNKKNLHKIFLRNGFKKAKLFDVKNEYPLSYWFRMLPIPKIMKSLISRFLTITKLGELPLSLRAGNIGIYAYA